MPLYHLAIEIYLFERLMCSQPHVGVKSSPNFSKSCPKSICSSTYIAVFYCHTCLHKSKSICKCFGSPQAEDINDSQNVVSPHTITSCFRQPKATKLGRQVNRQIGMHVGRQISRLGRQIGRLGRQIGKQIGRLGRKTGRLGRFSWVDRQINTQLVKLQRTFVYENFCVCFNSAKTFTVNIWTK